MTTNKNVTIWHYGDLVTPERRIFKKVFVDVVKGMDKNGIKQKGFFDSTKVIVRIPTTEEISAMPGDYLFIGESFDQGPGDQDTVKIIEVKDNRRGGQKHWRIVCGE